MKVAEFRSFLGLADLAALEPGEPRLTFSPGPLIYVHYQGMHCSGVTRDKRGVISIDDLTAHTSVSVKTLMGSLSLFADNADVSVRCTDANLILTSPGRRASLRISTGEAYRTKASQTAQTRLAIAADDLQAALRFLVPITSSKLGSPILTGVNMSIVDGCLSLLATDGARVGKVDLKAVVKITDNAAITAPAIDMQEALNALSGDIQLMLSANQVELVDQQTYVRVGTLSGSFPDLARLPTVDLYKIAVTLDSDAVTPVAKAAALLGDAHIVTLTVKDKRVALRVESQELGSFILAAGDNVADDTSVSFDSDYLDLASKLSGPLTVRIQDRLSPVLIESANDWLYWLAPVSKIVD